MKSTRYFKIIIFGLLIFIGLGYLIDVTALDLIQKPELIISFALLIITILFNGKIVNNLRKIKFEKLTQEEQQALNQHLEKNIWWTNLLQKLTKTKPIEEEKDILMNHEYDGIRELDNDLPPWWIYSFYASIIAAIMYMSYYHIFDGDNQIVEFEKEMAQAKIDIAEYKKTAKNLVDASNVALLTDSKDLSKGKKIFETSCVVCHLSDGGGSIGPNLTDEYWILGGGIKNVFTTVSEGGRDGKGMIPWKSTLSPAEIAQVSSYVLSFQGTTPAKAKDHQGEIWLEKEAE